MTFFYKCPPVRVSKTVIVASESEMYIKQWKKLSNMSYTTKPCVAAVWNEYVVKYVQLLNSSMWYFCYKVKQKTFTLHYCCPKKKYGVLRIIRNCYYWKIVSLWCLYEKVKWEKGVLCRVHWQAVGKGADRYASPLWWTSLGPIWGARWDAGGGVWWAGRQLALATASEEGVHGRLSTEPA